MSDEPAWSPGLLHVGQRLGNLRVRDVAVAGESTAALHVVPAAHVTAETMYVAYYGTDRYLRVAVQAAGRQGEWERVVLDTRVDWDSHNFPAVAVDRAGALHVAANMHNAPLVYFRTESAGDLHSLTSIPTMVDPQIEQRVTYPRLVRARDGELAFFFRDGGSGDGNYEGLVYDEEGSAWHRLSPVSLIDGERQRSAYLDTNGAILGPDGRHHLVWAWRESPEAQSTTTVAYACSQDLREWTALDGTRLELPMRFDTAEIVDPVPVGAGLINNNVRLGFDRDANPVIAYHRRDDAGYMQIWAARGRRGTWKRYQLTDWQVNWDFGGRGSLDFKLQLGKPRPTVDGLSLMVRIGSRVVELQLTDDLTLKGINDDIRWSEVMAEPAGDGTFWFAASAEGVALGHTEEYVSWRSVPARRDRPLDAPEPPPSPVLVVSVQSIADDPDAGAEAGGTPG